MRRSGSSRPRSVCSPSRGRPPSRRVRWLPRVGSRRCWCTTTSAGFLSSRRAVIDRGFKELDRAFSQLPVTEDPIADLAVQALTCRRVARENPHLYDLMFGLSTRATYRPVADSGVRLSGRSPAFRGAYAHMARACARLVRSGRIRQQDPEVVAAQLWSFVHGFITLELADTFVDFDEPVRQILLPMGVNLSVGLGDTRERAQASHEAAARIYASIARPGEGQAGV